MTVVVASGKGGTGKTTVSVGLALSLDGPVDLLDCDVEAPNTHLLLGGEVSTQGGGSTGHTRFTIPVPRVDPDRCTGCGKCAAFCAFGALAVVRGRVLFFDDLCHACGGCALVCPEGAISEEPHEIGTIREALQLGSLRQIAGEIDVGQTLAPPLIRAVRERSSAPVTIIDAAPGTTCPVVEAARGADAGLLVTENTPFGLHDLALAAEVFARLGIPTAIIVNRSGIGYPTEDRLRGISERFGFPVVLRIPFSHEVARAYAEGQPIVDAVPGIRDEFRAVYARLTRLAEATRTAESTEAAS